MRLATLLLFTSAVLLSPAPADVPVFEVSHADSTINFAVKASVPIEGKFDKWDATVTFTSPELSTGVLDIKIQAGSVDTGSGMKDSKLKSKDFFDAEHDPLITFHSTKVEQTGPNTVAFEGDFTIRGVTKQETLTFTVPTTGKASAPSKGRWRSTASNSA